MYSICGHCLHAISCHEKNTDEFMYCGVCFSLCDVEEFNYIHKPTGIQKVMEIGAKKQ